MKNHNKTRYYPDTSEIVIPDDLPENMVDAIKTEAEIKPFIDKSARVEGKRPGGSGFNVVAPEETVIKLAVPEEGFSQQDMKKIANALRIADEFIARHHQRQANGWSERVAESRAETSRNFGIVG